MGPRPLRPPAARGHSVPVAILLGCCPRCRRGRMFRGAVEMNRACPACGLVFAREPGYFLGAMYISYPLSMLLLGINFLLILWFLPGWGYEWVLLLAIIPYLPFVPWVFRMSRVLWIYFERAASQDAPLTGEGPENDAARGVRYPPSGNGRPERR